MTMYRQVTVLTLSFVIVGLGLLVVAAVLSLQTRSFMASAVATPGWVVGLEPSHSGHATYYTVFAYADERGMPHTNRTDWAQNPPPFSIGSQITVLFPPSRPEAAQIKSFSALWLIPTVLWGFGLGFTVVGTLAFFAARKTYGND